MHEMWKNKEYKNLQNWEQLEIKVPTIANISSNKLVFDLVLTLNS